MLKNFLKPKKHYGNQFKFAHFNKFRKNFIAFYSNYKK